MQGLPGSAIALNNFFSVNLGEWLNVIIGLVWSIFGTWIIVKILYKNLNKKFYKIDAHKIKKYQKYSAFGLSFMHGAQDGQKFIGIVILFIHIIKNKEISLNLKVVDCTWIIIFVSSIMFVSVCIGGKKIVENLGNIAKLDNVKGILSDLGTVISLFIASIFGIPVSTTHVKTMSIASLNSGNRVTNQKSLINIFKTWIWTFPACFGLAWSISKLMLKIAT